MTHANVIAAVLCFCAAGCSSSPTKAPATGSQSGGPGYTPTGIMSQGFDTGLALGPFTYTQHFGGNAGNTVGDSNDSAAAAHKGAASQ